MTDLDRVIDGRVPLTEVANLKSDIKILFAALVTKHTKDYLLIKKLRQEIDRL